ncbi:uncharacterized protein KGF55_000041 [Candida pseudojiufengensis]|uniref:uncharacterized protein n=1 Tax=Candida pseudojiufengensis TaxID=497109 RepID=UPI0022241DFC|nr:uncharacterized protein KGF55_000041 [Candida pseudojiufengensis]KAI5968057.1 hypothetical protein KGF55_000041 [Candida pseudojiufengensis]
MGLNLLFIVSGTLITGAANSLLTKFQDNQCVRNCSFNNNNLQEGTKPEYFNQPGIQTLQMFLGELLIYFVYLIYRYNKIKNNQIESNNNEISWYSNLKLAIPAICDLSCTTLLNIGLIYIPVSIYQMTRGSVVLFVAIFSTIFLKRKISNFKWLSLIFVTLGVCIVGLSGSSKSGGEEGQKDIKMIIFGICLVIGATSLQGIQFVVEENILEKNPIIPLQLVYIEGLFGSLILISLMILLNFIFKFKLTQEEFLNSPFNLYESFYQLISNKIILGTSFLIMLSISSFNYFGLSITHQVSATARSTIDTCRTLLVWLIALIIGWESFKFLQLIGFIILVFGTLCFNDVITVEQFNWLPNWLKENDKISNLEDEESRNLIDEEIEERLIGK